MADPKSDKLKEVYGDRTVDDQRAIYREWAETYDAQTTGEFGWVGFKSAAIEVEKRVPDRKARILDAGCGTGFAGRELAALGYENLHGRDLSPEMLKQAEGLGVYSSLEECDLTQPLDETHYDAIISVGVFGFGPPDPEHICHLVNVLKKECLLTMTVNGKGWIDRDWSEVLKQVVSDQGLNLVEQLDIEYLEKEEIGGKLLIFKA